MIRFEEKEMEYFRFGNREGRKLIILPGLSLKSVMGSAEAVTAAYDLPAKDYDVYLFDHIRIEPEGYSIKDMADDTVKALKELGLKKVNLMGVSLGGMISQMIAINHPDVVESIILCSATSRIREDQRALFENWKRLAERRDLEDLMLSFGESVYSPSFYEQYKDIILASGNGASELDYANFIASINAMLYFDVYNELYKISCPMLVLGAGEDKAVGVEASNEIIEKLGCDHYIYEGYGHGVYDEAPDYLSRIKEFLDKN